MDYSIGELARRSGYAVQTLRYYEGVGLMPLPPRSTGGQRRYDSEHLRRLLFIRHARDLGFSVDQIRTLLALQDTPDQPCSVVDEIARERLLEVEARIASLKSLQRELRRLVGACGKGTVGQCRVIEALVAREGE